MDNGTPITETDWTFDLQPPSDSPKLVLVRQLPGAEADEIKEQMRVRQAAETEALRKLAGRRGLWPRRRRPAKSPVPLEPQPTDEVWDYSTSRESWQHRAGRCGYALVRDGVVIYEITTAMS